MLSFALNALNEKPKRKLKNNDFVTRKWSILVSLQEDIRAWIWKTRKQSEDLLGDSTLSTGEE